MRLNISSSQRSDVGKRRFQLAALVTGLAALCAVVAMWPGGVIGFLQGIAERGDAIAAVVLASGIALFFVILYRVGVPLETGDEARTAQPQ
ncbi:MAG TPA: hypothetical protein VJ742_02955 [Nitrososphaera sp.]|nr:hypothetical protein [Nitrososphaera sp.]